MPSRLIDDENRRVTPGGLTQGPLELRGSIGGGIQHVRLFPIALTMQLDESGVYPPFPAPYALALRGIAAMSECGVKDTLQIKTRNWKTEAEFSPLHLTHLWPEPLVMPSLLDTCSLKAGDTVHFFGPPRAIVVTYWLAKVEAR